VSEKKLATFVSTTNLQQPSGIPVGGIVTLARKLSALSVDCSEKLVSLINGISYL
jgi:hypothetical protein